MAPQGTPEFNKRSAFPKAGGDLRPLSEFNLPGHPRNQQSVAKQFGVVFEESFRLASQGKVEAAFAHLLPYQKWLENSDFFSLEKRSVALGNLANLALHNNRLDVAEDAIIDALRLSRCGSPEKPVPPLCVITLVGVFEAKGDFCTALQLLDDEIGRYDKPKGIDVVRYGSISSRIEWMGQLIAKRALLIERNQPEEKAVEAYSAYVHWAKKEKSQRELIKALGAQSDFLWELGRYEEVLDNLESALDESKQGPQSLFTPTSLAIASSLIPRLFLQGQFDRGRFYLKQARNYIENDSGTDPILRVTIYAYSGLSLYLNKEQSTGFADLQKAIDIEKKELTADVLNKRKLIHEFVFLRNHFKQKGNGQAAVAVNHLLQDYSRVYGPIAG